MSDETLFWIIISLFIGFLANEGAHLLERELEARDKIQKKRKGTNVPTQKTVPPMPEKRKTVAEIEELLFGLDDNDLIKVKYVKQAINEHRTKTLNEQREARGLPRVNTIQTKEWLYEYDFEEKQKEHDKKRSN